jgi:hypothetical protein
MDEPETREDAEETGAVEPAPPPVRRAPDQFRAPPSKLFALRKPKPSWTDWAFPLLMVGLAVGIFYWRFHQGGLRTEVIAVNGSHRGMTMQIGVNRHKVPRGGSVRVTVWNASGEEINILNRQGVDESKVIPSPPPPVAIYNINGAANLLLVDYSWAYSGSSGPKFKVIANLRGERLYPVLDDADVLGPNEDLPRKREGMRPIYKVERMPADAMEFPDGYLRGKLEDAGF